MFLAFYRPFCIFYLFVDDKGVSLTPTYSSIEMRNSDLRRTVKNDGKSSQNCSQKRLGSVTRAPRLGFSSRKHIFSPKIVEMHSIGVMDPLEQPP